MQANEQAGREEPAPKEVSRFNFSRAGQLGIDHQRTLRALDEQLARNLTYALGAWLRTDVAVSPLSSEQSTYFVFAERAGGSEYTFPVRMEPLHVRGAVGLDLKLLSPMVDLLLGGSGKPAHERRDLTEIEEAILRSVVEIVVRELNTGWRALGCEFLLEAMEGDGQEQRLMLATEKVLALHFEVLMPDLRGTLSLCLPTAAISTVLRQLNTRPGHIRNRGPEERAAMAKRLRKSAVVVHLQMPAFRLDARTLQSMQPGQTLRLALDSDSMGQLEIAGTSVSPAQPVCAGERRGARLVEAAPSVETAGIQQAGGSDANRE